MNFEPQGLGHTIFKERYAFDPDETFPQACHRVANAVAQAENHKVMWEENFSGMLLRGEFMPGGRVWYGAGRKKQAMLNCFVIPTEDSITGWGRTVSDLMEISALGGGVGINFTPLRERGATISRGGESTGAVSLMEICNGVGEVLRAGGGRRVAMMHCLSMQHKDVNEFIDKKLNKHALNNANVSVVIPPGVEYEEMFNNEMWDSIIHNSWNSGEPGVLNQKLASERCRMGGGYLISTNPCLTGDTVIATVSGNRTFKELADYGKDVQVYSWHPKTRKPVVRWMRNPRLTRKNVPVLRIEFDSGLVVKATYDHSFYSSRGEKVKAKDLTVGKSIRAFSMSQHRDGHLRVHSWDKETNSANHQWVHRMVWENEHGPVPEGYVIHHTDHDPTNNILANLELMSSHDHQSLHYPERFEAGFDGTCANHKVVSIKEGGSEHVYNGTVDDSHSYIVVDPEPRAGILSGIVSANCGEIWLPAYGCCCLGALVLTKFITYDGKFDFTRFGESVRQSIRFLDNVLTVNDYPLPEIEAKCKDERRIGLGVMGLHSAMMMMGIAYGSPESFEFVDKLFSYMRDTADSASVALGVEKGHYPLYKDSDGIARRNIACLTIAPTGTTSMVHEVTSGIEPMFAPAYIRRRYRGDIIERTLVVTKDYQLHGALARGAYDVPVARHFRIQAIAQKYIDNAVSKTINIPEDYPVEALKTVWQEYLPQLKGTTIYRQGSRENEPMEFVPIQNIPEMIRDWDGELSVDKLSVRDDCESGLCEL